MLLSKIQGQCILGNDPSSTTDGADYNVSVGTTALDAITTGYSNTALGYNSLTANLAGDRNTAVGSQCFKIKYNRYYKCSSGF